MIEISKSINLPGWIPFLTLFCVIYFFAMIEVQADSTFKLYGQYVNDDCTPISDATIIMDYRTATPINLVPSWLRWIQDPGTRTDITDRHGYFNGSVSSYSPLTVSEQASSTSRSFSERDLPELIKQNREDNPLILYKSLYANNTSRVTDRGTTLFLADDRVHDQHIGPIRIKSGSNMSNGDMNWYLELNVSDGGFISVPVESLPFSEELPLRGYNKKVRIEFTGDDVDAEKQSAYYFSAQNGNVYGTLILKASLIAMQYNLDIDVSLLYDYLHDESENRIDKPVLPQRRCGGSMAFEQGGYYATLMSPYSPKYSHDESMRLVERKKRIYLGSKMASDPKVPMEWLLDPNNIIDKEVLREVLRNPKTDADVVSRLYHRHSEDEGMVVEIAGSNKTPVSVIRELVKSQKYDRILPYNRNTPSDVLLLIINRWKENPGATDVLRSIATHPNLSREGIEKLVDVENDTVRGEIARRSDVDPDIMRKLGKIPSGEVR